MYVYASSTAQAGTFTVDSVSGTYGNSRLTYGAASLSIDTLGSNLQASLVFASQGNGVWGARFINEYSSTGVGDSMTVKDGSSYNNELDFLLPSDPGGGWVPSAVFGNSTIIRQLTVGAFAGNSNFKTANTPQQFTVLGGGARFQALQNHPTAPALSGAGSTGGTTTYSYVLVARDFHGNQTLATPVGTTTTGQATLSAGTPITVAGGASFDAVAGVYRYMPLGTYSVDFVRTDGPGGVGLIGTTNLTTRNAQPILNDTGQAATAYTLPTRNATGDVTIDGILNVGAEGITFPDGTTITSTKLNFSLASFAATRAAVAGDIGVTSNYTNCIGFMFDSARQITGVRWYQPAGMSLPVTLTIFGFEVGGRLSSDTNVAVTAGAINTHTFTTPVSAAAYKHYGICIYDGTNQIWFTANDATNHRQLPFPTIEGGRVPWGPGLMWIGSFYSSGDIAGAWTFGTYQAAEPIYK